jgi:hypothetical protein
MLPIEQGSMPQSLCYLYLFKNVSVNIFYISYPNYIEIQYIFGINKRYLFTKKQIKTLKVF